MDCRKQSRIQTDFGRERAGLAQPAETSLRSGDSVERRTLKLEAQGFNGPTAALCRGAATETKLEQLLSGTAKLG